jgi:hypothetical protein
MATAIGMAAVEAGGVIAEDVFERIFRLSPVERPLIDSIGRTDADNYKKEFVDETLPAPSSTETWYENQDLSGVDDTNLGLRYYNLCQQQGAVIKGSQRSRDVRQVYRGSDEYLRQLMKAGEWVRINEEAAAVSRNAATAEVAATSGALMAGCASWAIHNATGARGAGGADAVLDGATNVGGGPTTAPTAGTARGFTETLMRDTLRIGWDEGAAFNLMMSTGDMIENVGGYMYSSSSRIAAMQTNVPQSNRTGADGGNGAREGGIVAQGAVNMFIGNFGSVVLTPNRQMATYDSSGTDCVDVLFVDTRYPMMAYLHNYATKSLSEVGLYDQEALYVDSCLFPGATHSIATVSDIDPTVDMVA